MNERKRWLVVVGYAVAMAWVEAAVVFYLRTMANRINPYQANPLPDVAGLSWVELVREAATLVMLLTVGVLAGRDWCRRWGYAAVAFGIWDIFYYLFLRIITHWPQSVLDWDILFLIPLPWWGPVLAPVIIAALMIIWGTLASQFGQERLVGSHGIGSRGCWVLWAWRWRFICSWPIHCGSPARAAMRSDRCCPKNSRVAGLRLPRA